MGIRIHKVLGYGLTNTIVNKERWDFGDDPRFNKDGYIFHDEYDDKYSIAGFIEYLTSRADDLGDDSDEPVFELRFLIRDLKDKSKKRKYGFYDSVIYDIEMGMDGVMCFVPPSQVNTWSRYDDTLDYYDPVNHSSDGGIKESLIMIDRGLYPWDGYMNIKQMPPTRLTGVQQHHYNTLKNIGFNNVLKTPTVFESMGVDNIQELEVFIIPTIPFELVELIRYLEIFVDDSCIYQLRPMIYGYWS